MTGAGILYLLLCMHSVAFELDPAGSKGSMALGGSLVQYRSMPDYT